VPNAVSKTFKKGDLTYRVETHGDFGGTFILARSHKQLLRTELKDLSASVSVVWSDDQKNFAITWSDGGAIGGFHVHAFRIDGDSVTRLPATKQAWTAFTSRHWCKERGDNIQAHSWYPDSQSLVLVLSVYPTGDCGSDLGHTEGFVVDASSGEIREHWDIRQLNAYLKSHPE
jgi:hypothetical protein